MQIKKIKKYEITFDHVDERIDIENVDNYRYIKSHYLMADSKESAIEYAKSLIEEIKNLHLTDEKGNELNYNLYNGYSQEENDYDTLNIYYNQERYWYILRTPLTKDKWKWMIEIEIKSVELISIEK